MAPSSLSLLLSVLLLGHLSVCPSTAQLDFSKIKTGDAVFHGDGTYYGQQGGQSDQGACSFGSLRANTLDLDWKAGVKTYIALNRPQFYASSACGLCIMFRGLGQGLGMLPISGEWQYGFVDNECPECEYGSIDLNYNGDGRWKIEWYPIPCQMNNNGTFHYWTFPGANAYWFMFVISNTRVPIKSVEADTGSGYYQLRRNFNNNWAVDGQYKLPMKLRITSVLGDAVEDTLTTLSPSTGSAQFPDRGSTFVTAGPTPLSASVHPSATPGAAPSATPAAQGVSAAGRRMLESH